MSLPPLTALALLLAVSTACARHHDPAPAAAPVPVSPVVTMALVRDTIPTPPVAPPDSAKVHEYRGAFSSGFEISWFEPCDAAPNDALWWVTLTEEARLQRDSLIKLLPHKPTEGLAVRWLATVSPKMARGAGHMARGTRYMLVTKILSLRALGPEGACTGPSRIG